MTCKNCGENLDSNAKFCISCGTPVPPPEKKKKKKAPIIIAIAVVLVLALVAGGVFIAFAGAPTTKVYGALKNTLFESSEYEIEFKCTYDEDEDAEEYIKADIKLTLDKDVDSSVFDMTVTEQWNDYYYDDYYYDDAESNIVKNEQSLVIKDSKIYFDGEQEGTLKEYYGEIEEELEYYTDKNIDIEKELNNLINGKFDEKALETLYNETIKPILEDLIKEETDESVELPEYKDVLGKSGTLSDLFKNKDVQETLELEKTKSDLPGTTYEYTLDIQDLAEAVLNYAMEDKQYMEYLETIADYCDFDDVDELVDEIVEAFDDYDNLEGTITIKSNRITHFTLDAEYAKIEISITSK